MVVLGKPMEKRDVGVELYRIPAVWRGEEESLGDPQELSEKRTLPFTVSYVLDNRGGECNVELPVVERKVISRRLY